MNPNLYEAWLKYLFDHDEAKGKWHFNHHYQRRLEENAVQVVTFTKRMFDNYNTDIAPYSDWQIAMGLNYIFNSSLSDLAFKLMDSSIPLEKRLDTIRSMKILYEDCFAERCPPALGHYSEVKGELGKFCYMIWDVSPLSHCTNKQEKPEYYAALFEVLETGLNATNIACIESALHGLGEIAPYYKPAVGVIEKAIPWIRRKGGPRLLAYAEAAKTGMIQ